jgi:hypothetical protein
MYLLARDWWRIPLTTVMNFKGFVKGGEFRDNLRDLIYGCGDWRMETLLYIKCN